MWRKGKELKNKGFTIVEVLIAIVIFSLAFSSFFYFLNQMMSNTTKLTQRIAFEEAKENILRLPSTYFYNKNEFDMMNFHVKLELTPLTKSSKIFEDYLIGYLPIKVTLFEVNVELVDKNNPDNYRTFSFLKTIISK